MHRSQFRAAQLATLRLSRAAAGSARALARSAAAQPPRSAPGDLPFGRHRLESLVHKSIRGIGPYQAGGMFRHVGVYRTSIARGHSCRISCGSIGFAPPRPASIPLSSASRSPLVVPGTCTGFGGFGMISSSFLVRERGRVSHCTLRVLIIVRVKDFGSRFADVSCPCGWCRRTTGD